MHHEFFQCLFVQKNLFLCYVWKMVQWEQNSWVLFPSFVPFYSLLLGMPSRFCSFPLLPANTVFTPRQLASFIDLIFLFFFWLNNRHRWWLLFVLIIFRYRSLQSLSLFCIFFPASWTVFSCLAQVLWAYWPLLLHIFLSSFLL